MNTEPKNLEAIAETLDAAGLWPFSEAAKALVGDIPYSDGVAVGSLIARRKVARAVEAFETTPAIKAYMQANLDARGARAPEKCDMSWMKLAGKRTTDQYGKTRAPYAADPKCPLRLKLAEAVRWTSIQEAYSDDSETLIPVVGEAPADLAACQRNLAAFVRYADNHTGLAGSGANWTASLVQNGAGLLAVIHCRSSIAD